MSFPSELGWMGLVRTGGVLTRLVFGWASQAEALERLDWPTSSRRRPPRELNYLVARLQQFANGRPDAFEDVAVDYSGRTDFQRTVLEQCRRIPHGEVATYGELATRAGYPRSARAVGCVMAGNRVPLIIPCHRVVAADGRLGGFSAPEGTDMKRRLLRLEGVSHVH